MAKVRDAARSKTASRQRADIVSRVSAESLLPFVHQRHDDLSPVGSD